MENFKNNIKGVNECRTTQQLIHKETPTLSINKTSGDLSKSIERLNLINNQLKQSSDFSGKVSYPDNIWSGFHKKTIHERQLQLKKIDKDINLEKLKTGGLDLIRADSMIENCIGVISIPVGLGLNFLINGVKYIVPMAVEEPSIIAAVSAAAKLISENSGFIAYSDPPLMIAQIHIIDTDTDQTMKRLRDNKDKIITNANNHCQSMVQRGGGVTDLSVKKLGDKRVTLELVVNVCESMGANLLNTLAEKTADYIERFIEGRIILKILSNLSVFRKATSEFKINVKNLNYKGIKGEEIAKRICEAYDIAVLDTFRTATHNKGVMNGIDAVAVALGQDWRALEAAAHTYAAINHSTFEPEKIKPFTHFQMIKIQNEYFLYGKLTMPIAVGVVGGAIQSNENYTNLLKLLGNPSATVLSQILVSVGLAQNLAALRALVSEGIQRGHMSLHAKNIAHAAGVPDYLIPDVVDFMKKNNSITDRTAKQYLESHSIFIEIRKNGNGRQTINLEPKNFSTFYIELDYPFLKEPIIMNVILNTKIDPPIHLTIKKNFKNEDHRTNKLVKILFGETKSEEWIYEYIKFVNHFDFTKNEKSELYSRKYKVKLLIILFFTITQNLLKFDYSSTTDFLNRMFQHNYNYDELHTYIPNLPIEINYGMYALLEVYEILKFHLSNLSGGQTVVINKIFKEIEFSVKCFINITKLNNAIQKNEIKITPELFDTFFESRLERLNATLIILVDLAYSEIKVDDGNINLFLDLGRYVEITMTLLRDYARHKENPYLNSYLIFLKLHGSEDKDLRELYMNYRKEEREVLKNSVMKLSKSVNGFMNMLNSIEKEFYRYYKLEPKF
jgi:degradative hydroxymethylglutaryl-CoA reductase